jgi:hypothetical protein
MERVTSRLGRVGTGVLTVMLWLLTAFLGLWEIVVIQKMVLRVYSRLFADGSASGHDYWGSVALGNWLVLILGVIWIATVIGLGEYYYKHFGEPESWKWFGRVIGAQLAILVLAFFV